MLTWLPSRWISRLYRFTSMIRDLNRHKRIGHSFEYTWNKTVSHFWLIDKTSGESDNAFAIVCSAGLFFPIWHIYWGILIKRSLSRLRNFRWLSFFSHSSLLSVSSSIETSRLKMNPLLGFPVDLYRQVSDSSMWSGVPMRHPLHVMKGRSPCIHPELSLWE